MSDEFARERATALRDAHDGVRLASRMTGKTSVTARLPVDVLGVYVYLPHVTV